MKQLLWIFLALLFVSAANASQEGTYGYGYWAPKHISDYLKDVDGNSPKEGARQCENVYANALNRGVLDIRYALGYFDDSRGEDSIVNGINYGLSPSLDIEIFHALRKQLTANCWSFSKRLCGFKESGDAETGKVVLTKQEKIHGRKITVRITLTQASASSSFAQNKGASASRQSMLTQQSEENFFGGLRTADVVIYNGHSRNGGGPDFNPPILNSHNKVNYKGYYEKKRPGIIRTIENLKHNPNQGFILGMFSCYSRKHFYQTFMDANPQQGLVLSADTIDYFDALKGSVGYLEGILRGSCGDELSESAKQNDKIRIGFEDYNIH
ncbi:hypothetical protein [Bdellovibrio sp. HCB337]|uniref:hypothetical protein n=1 Tax=Bdellovibrio sp. HCB337 TaxID=3394358 RepID=UPI0039A60B56